MKNIVIIIAFAALFLFSGCMAVSMLGHGGGHSNQSSSSSTTIQKEVTSNGVKAEVTFPPLVLNEETTFILKITDAETGKPSLGLSVWFHASYTNRPTEHHGGMMGNSSHHSGMEDQHGGMMDDSSHHSEMENQQGSTLDHSSDHSRMEEPHGINYDTQLTDSVSPGTFSVPFTPNQTGEYVMSFHIVRDRQNQGEDIVVEQKLVVAEESHSSGGMMGSLGPYAIVAGAAMAALMVYFWASGSSMF